MSAANGHGPEERGTTSAPPLMLAGPATAQLPAERVRDIVAALEVPFDPSQIEWRVTNTTKGQQPARGQVVPYADQRAYTDRLNALFTPAGWTRKYTIHTSANFERSKDQKIAAKVLVTCELTIFGVGSHSATGEEWADDDNAGTAAEAQAFKRACACFGLGRYLYHFTRVWVDLDERKRPKSVPKLFGWATPEGWRAGQRPAREGNSALSDPGSGGNGKGVFAAGARPDPGELNGLVGQIEGMADALGKRLYRGILKNEARVWNPSEIHEVEVLRRILEQMQAAEGELRKLDAALNRVEPGALAATLRALGLRSLDQIDSFERLKKVVLGVERTARIAG